MLFLVLILLKFELFNISLFCLVLNFRTLPVLSVCSISSSISDDDSSEFADSAPLSTYGDSTSLSDISPSSKSLFSSFSFSSFCSSSSFSSSSALFLPLSFFSIIWLSFVFLLTSSPFSFSFSSSSIFSFPLFLMGNDLLISPTFFFLLSLSLRSFSSNFLFLLLSNSISTVFSRFLFPWDNLLLVIKSGFSI